MSNQAVQSSKEPFARIVKKAEMSGKNVILLRLMAFILAIIAGGIFILFIGENPFKVYATIVAGAFRSALAFRVQ